MMTNFVELGTEKAGYAGKILRIDLSSGRITHAHTWDYAPKFLGGRGLAAKIYWDDVPPETKAFDPDNPLLIFIGPLCGFPGVAGSRWQVCGKSPSTYPEHFSYSNLGGSWGFQLRRAGYDGLVIQGKSDLPVYLFIQDSVVEIRDATSVWGKKAIEVREALKAELGSSVNVLTTGPAGENRVSYASLLADNDAAGSCGFGAVMGSKNLKAIVVLGSGSVKAAQPERLRKLLRHILKFAGSRSVDYASPLDLPNLKRDPCHGCSWNCIRMTYRAADGSRGKLMCQAGFFYLQRAFQYYGEQNEVFFHAARLCNDYGLDAIVVEGIIMWLSRCQKAGILNDDNTGIPLSRMGSMEFIETLIRKIALREGFGDILAQGPVKAAELVGNGAPKLITDYILKAGQSAYYEGRAYITTGLFYAMEPRQPIQQLHEISGPMMRWVHWATKKEGPHLSSAQFRAIARRFWGSELAADFSTYEGKALAAKKIQDRQYAKECLILCDFAWPIIYAENSEDHMGDPTLESQVFSAYSGKEVDEEGLYVFGERVFNLQRAIMVREGHRGRQDDRLPEQFYTIPMKKYYPQAHNPECLVPGKKGEIISRKGTVVDREKFEKMKTEYYKLRGWDPVTGFQKKAKLNELGLADVAGDMEKQGL